MHYSCVGFDVRVWPCDGRLSCGESEWSKEEDCYDHLREKFALKENLYQLLEIDNQNLLNEIVSHLKGVKECKLISLSIPRGIAQINSDRYGYPIGYALSLKDFDVCGVDVGDINGFFSALSHPWLVNYRGTSNLIEESNVKSILDIVQLAGFLDKGHAPYSAVKIMSMRSVK